MFHYWSRRWSLLFFVVMVITHLLDYWTRLRLMQHTSFARVIIYITTHWILILREPPEVQMWFQKVFFGIIQLELLRWMKYFSQWRRKFNSFFFKPFQSSFMTKLIFSYKFSLQTPCIFANEGKVSWSWWNSHDLKNTVGRTSTKKEHRSFFQLGVMSRHQIRSYSTS